MSNAASQKRFTKGPLFREDDCTYFASLSLLISLWDAASVVYIADMCIAQHYNVYTVCTDTKYVNKLSDYFKSDVSVPCYF